MAGAAAVLAFAFGLGTSPVDAAVDSARTMSQIYRANADDTLLDIARRNDLGYVEIIAANPNIDPWMPGAGTDVILPVVHLLPDAPHDGIVINLAELRLYVFAGEDEPPITYPIGIGREGWETPLGTTAIVRKKVDPSWYPPVSIRELRPELPGEVPPGPENPLGNRALYLGWNAYLIHGTNKPWGVGRRVSSGCIRLYPEDIERLYEQAGVGVHVAVVHQPTKLGWVDDELYIEVHSTQEQADIVELGEQPDARLPAAIVEQVRNIAGSDAGRIDWATVRQAVLERRGYPVRITRPERSGSLSLAQ